MGLQVRSKVEEKSDPYNNLFLTNQCNEFLEVKIQERQSGKIAKDARMGDVANGLYDIPSMSLRTSLGYPTTGSGTHSTSRTAYFSTLPA